MKSDQLYGCYARKWRRKPSYRLLFFVTGDEVTFFALRPRKDAYEVAAQRLRVMGKPRLV